MNAGTYELRPPWRTGIFRSSLGFKVRYGVWWRRGVKPEFALLFVNGRNEFIEKYNYLPDDLIGQSQALMVTWDHPGQGGSGGRRSHIDSFDEFALVAREVVSRQVPAGIPLFILAHSMGALVALLACHRDYFEPQRILLSSPFLGMPEGFVNNHLARPLATLLKGFGQGSRYLRAGGRGQKEEFASNQRTHSSVRFYRLLAAPYQGFTVTFSWVCAALKAIDVIHGEAFMGQFRVPVDLWSGEKEAVVSSRAMQTWSSQLNRRNPGQVRLHPVAGARHELLYEEEILYHPLSAQIREILRKSIPEGTALPGGHNSIP